MSTVFNKFNYSKDYINITEFKMFKIYKHVSYASTCHSHVIIYTDYRIKGNTYFCINFIGKK